MLWTLLRVRLVPDAADAAAVADAADAADVADVAAVGAAAAAAAVGEELKTGVGSLDVHFSARALESCCIVLQLHRSARSSRVQKCHLQRRVAKPPS